MINRQLLRGLFTDQELDTTTGLYNYDARFYDPVIGRFISPDTIIPDLYNPQSLNRYSYCFNNPLIYTDPNGRAAVSLTIFGFAIIIGGDTLLTYAGTTVGIIAGTALGYWLSDLLFNKEGNVETRLAPPANNGVCRPHGNPDHWDAIQKRIEKLRNDPKVDDIRVNQRQVDKDGNIVGKNKPDLQWNKTDEEGKKSP